MMLVAPRMAAAMFSMSGNGGRSRDAAGTEGGHRGIGAPLAQEDHARRACYARLHLQQELRPYADQMRLGRGLGFSVWMGLDSGDSPPLTEASASHCTRVSVPPPARRRIARYEHSPCPR